MRSTNYRLVSVISPERELSLSYPLGVTDFVAYLLQLKKFAKNIQHFVTIIIPKPLLSIINATPSLKILSDLIQSDTQSPIIFSNIGSNHDGCTVNPSSLFGYHKNKLFTLDTALDVLKAIKPFCFIDLTHSHYTKSHCSICTPARLCTYEYKIPCIACQVDSTTLRELKSCTAVLLKNISSAAFCISINSLREFVIFYGCLLHDFPTSFTSRPILFHKLFVDDIRDAVHPLVNIVSSISRAVYFPTARKPGECRSLHSIDCHPHSPATHGQFNLFRCDVLPIGKTGLKGGSGEARLLLATHNDTVYIISYTELHEFSHTLLQVRLIENDFL